ncbi:MAG TPA: hypothetical protein DGT21_11390 [Armatimonadetes bacterium]|nr:hypothetical protein [Armatimonadota bacterium]
MPGPNWNWGPSAAMARDGSRLYAGTPEGLAVYTDPINTIGDEPDFYLSPGGPGSGSQDCTACALDETNDRVYAIYQTFSPNKTWVWGWTNASAITADRQADFGCQVPNVLANSIAVGGNDIVFLADAFDIFVFDGVHLDAGTEHAPDRRMTYVGHGEFQPMAYDEWRDLLYMFHAQEHWEHTIKVIENASTADGQDPACHEFGGSGSLIGGSNDRVVDITVFPDDDLLFVTNHGKSYILVFADASTLTGQVAPTNSVYVSDEIENAAIWRESE